MWRAYEHVSGPYRLWSFFYVLSFLELAKAVFDCFCWFSSSLDRKGQSHQVEYCSVSVEECSKSKIHKSEPDQGTEVLILSTSLIGAGEILESVAGSLFTMNERAITNAFLYLSFLLMKFLAFECKRICVKWNMSTALEQWRLELVQSKGIMGCQGVLTLYKRLVAREIVILGRHLVWSSIFFFEIYL